jgi:hypothetical protein
MSMTRSLRALLFSFQAAYILDNLNYFHIANHRLSSKLLLAVAGTPSSYSYDTFSTTK